MAEMTAKVPTSNVLLGEAKQFLDKIRESKIAGNLARVEREKRRRRFLVQLQQNQATIESDYLMDHLAQQLTRPCLEEERANYTVWRSGQ